MVRARRPVVRSRSSARAASLAIALTASQRTGSGSQVRLWCPTHGSRVRSVSRPVMRWAKVRPARFEVVTPSLSILAEPPVTVVDRNVDRKGTRKLAEAYLQFLYTEEAQDLIGKHFYRPISPQAQAKYAKQLPKLNLFAIDQAFGGWDQASKVHFADGAVFDQIYTRK